MDISKKRLIEIIANYNLQYYVPIYQRQYAWDEKNCEQLFMNMIDVKNLDKEHYIGSLVLSKPESVGGINKTSIIDGQQRITTLTLFILGILCNKNNNLDETNWNIIYNTFLVNQHKNELTTKVKLIENDQLIYEKILINLKNEIDWDNGLTFKDKDCRIIKNLQFFINKIDRFKFSLDDINQIFNNLLCAAIVLDEKDDPQLIFETMNSTGLSLNQGDLIKNFLLLDLKIQNQEEIYIKYWKEMENYLLEKDKIDGFFKHFLTIKRDKICKENKIYETFKNYFDVNWSGVDVESAKISVAENIYKYFVAYKKILEKDMESKKIKIALEILNILDFDTLNPLIIEVIYNYLFNDDSSWKNENKIKEIIEICISYALRRQFCDLPSATIANTIASLVKYTKQSNWYERLCYEFIKLENTSKSYFPDDETFKKHFVEKDFYFMRNRKEILEIIEIIGNYKNNDFSVNAIKNATLEHILPQGENLPESWKNELGDNWELERDKWVHTIGNITFTKYNSEMSNKSFIEKKNINGGFLDSNLFLNKYINTQNKWNINKIKERANLLFETILTVCKFPKLDEKVKDEIKQQNLNDDDNEISFDLDWYNLSYEQNNKYDDFLNYLEKHYKGFFVKPLYCKSYIKILLNNKPLFRVFFKKNNMNVYLYKLEENYKEKYSYNDVINANVMEHYPHYKFGINYDENNFFGIKNFLNQYIDGVLGYR